MNEQQINSKHHKFNFLWKEYVERKRKLQNYQFDKYQILARIGSGGFATVYRGIIIETKIQVAVKVINLKDIDCQKNPKLKVLKRRMAQTQSRIMMQFDSPNIIKCNQCFQSDDFKFMILQFCNGGNLLSQIEQRKKIPQDQAVSILKQIINGIAQCHKQKIIHRDLKPDNILAHNGVYKLADFGFSKQLQIKNENQLCKNTILGTMTTMAPEVVKRQSYGLKADIWSIGVIFFQMIFGQCPYASTQDHNKITEILTRKLIKDQFYQGVKLSEYAKKFLLQVLVVNIDQRLGWRELTDHKIFEQQQDKLQNSFNRKFQIQKLDQQILKIEKEFIIQQKVQESKLIQKNNQKDQNNRVNEIQLKEMKKQIPRQDLIEQNKRRTGSKQQIPSKQEINNNDQSIQRFNSQKLMINRQGSQNVPNKKSMMQINEYQIRLANDQEKQLFEWARKTHIECLKTELIYKNIVKVIEDNQLLDMTNRESIQLMYLLCTRCFNNMSPINFQYSIYTKSEVLTELSQNVSNLYKKVIQKWDHYCNLLKQKQNQKLSIASDWAKRVILSRLFPHKYNEAKKDKFLTGIQSMRQFCSHMYETQKPEQMRRQSIEQTKVQNGLQDYSKQEQIEYTLQYLKQMLKKQFFQRQLPACKQLFRYLDHFKQICQIRQQDLRKKTFKSFVEEITKQQ